MFKQLLLNSVILLFFFASICKGVSAQDDPVTRVWLNEEKTAKIAIYKDGDGKYYGKVVWLKRPTINGKIKVDIKNPDRSKRNRPLLGMMILKGLTKTADGIYEDGTIYDPLNGKTYSCRMSIQDGKLELRGYWGISFVGRSSIWTKAE